MKNYYDTVRRALVAAPAWVASIVAFHSAFLNVRPQRDSLLDGVAFRVDDHELRLFDRREQNYDRRLLEDEIAGVEGVVWIYHGSEASRTRFAQARTARDPIVVSQVYHEKVVQAFASHGAGAARRFAESTDAHGLPLRGMRCHRIPTTSRCSEPESARE